jgi:hypothetical protein
MRSSGLIVKHFVFNMVHFWGIFGFYLINITIFENNSLNIKYVFWLSLQILSETFLILRRIQRDITINKQRSSFKVTAI